MGLASAMSNDIMKDVEYDFKGVVTFGMPRVANSAFAAHMLKTIVAGKSRLGLGGFAYARDPVPHLPPRMFGYRSTQAKLFHMLGTQPLDTYAYWAGSQKPSIDLRASFSVSRVYWNSFKSFAGDKAFAEQTTTLKMADHMLYFSLEGSHGCGWDSSDKFLVHKTAAELFFM